MALEIKGSSRWWYARFLVNGKLRRFPLMETREGKLERIEIKGRRPPSLKYPEQGDSAFLDSYRRARAAHDRLLEEELSRRSVEDLAQRIIEAKTGTRLDFVKIGAVPEAWATIPRKRPPSKQYVETAQGKLRHFAAFMRKRFPQVDDLAEVRADHVRAFLDAEAARGVSARTWNIALKLLKTVFRKLEPNADAFRGYLKNAVLLDEETVHRDPFKDDEVDAILEAAREDEVLRGPLVTAVCTAMRRGDCVLLKWSSVDLKEDYIEVQTSKTGETAEIPIMPMLRAELTQAPKTKSEYVFPKAAELYLKDARIIDQRLRSVLARAGFVDARTIEKAERRKQEPRPSLPELPMDEVRRRGLKAIDAAVMGEGKRDRMKAIFSAYLDGKDMTAIAQELGVSKSTPCLHLNEIERMIGAAVVRRRPPPSIPAVIRGPLHKENGTKQRLHRGSIRGWHSFRVAFITRALAGGMPEELVRRVTGHTAIDVVREHYFRPDREDFRRAFEKAMPELAMKGAKSRDEQLREIVGRMTPKKLRDQALGILDGKQDGQAQPHDGKGERHA